MPRTTSKMGLATWDQLPDDYDYIQLSNNWNIVDFHDHTPGRGVPIPSAGIAVGAIGPLQLATGAVNDTNYTSQVSSSLPSGAFDGQVCHLLVDAVNGVIWSFRFRAASSSTHKWEFIGGSPLVSEVLTVESTTSVTPVDLATVGPQITLPTLPGDFDVTVGVDVQPALSSYGGSASLIINGVGVYGGADYIAFTTSGTTVASTSVARTHRQTNLTSASVLKVLYSRSGASTACSFGNRFMYVTPVRVG